MARPKDSWPLLRWRKTKTGRTAMVDCGMMQVEGKLRRVRFFYKTMEEAETKAALMRVKKDNEGVSSFGMPAAIRHDAEAAIALLAPHSKSLKEAAEFLLANIELIKEPKLIKDVVPELLDLLEKNKRAPRYIKDLRSKLSNGFATSFGERPIYTVSARELQDYVYGLDGVQGITRNNYQAALSVLFGFAKKRKYALTNPALEIEQANVEVVKPGILMVPEAEALMRHAIPELVPALALGLFSGLRPESEIWRLGWENIDLDERTIDITKSKNTASHRFVRISDNLHTWLKPIAKKRGPVSPTGDAYHWRLQKSRETAAAALEKAKADADNLLEWPQDCLRHSFASYHFAAFKNAGDTAEQIGHGGKLGTFFRHYRNRVKPDAAALYWQIFPAS
jgi:integrase/recombinase XerD